MAAMGGLNFLQADVEDGPKGLGPHKPGNTDLIRKMLREQQRECAALHANPFFKEYRNGGAVKSKKFGKGYVVAAEELSAPPQLLDSKSLDYEGKYRLFELIKDTAVKEERTQMGVWAAFNAPYMPLGDPKELQKSLPALNRDLMSSREGPRAQPRRKAKQGSQQAPAGGAAAAAQQQGPASPPVGGQGARASGGRGGKAPRDTSPNPANQAGSDDDDIGKPFLDREPGDGQHPNHQQQHLTPGAAAIRAATLQAEDTVNKHKSVLRFGAHDRAEAKFPAPVLRQADSRMKKVKSAAGGFVSRHEAQEELRDPVRSYGQPALPRKNLAPIPVANRSGRGGGAAADADDGTSSFFLTQQQQVAMGLASPSQDDGRRFSSFEGEAGSPSVSARQASSRLGADGFGFGAGSQSVPGGLASPSAAAGGGAADGAFTPLVDTAVPRKGDEANPVYKWHNDFVAVRQEGRAKLQDHLYNRAQGRSAARGDPSAAAGMSTTLLGQLNLMHGRMPNYAATAVKVTSPYTRMDQFQQAQEAVRRSSKQKAVAALDQGEIRILQRFYDQLCALVEAQRMSDPLCLMVVSKVKALLEAGTYLHRPMLTSVLEHVAEFTKGAGLVRYNKYLLAVLTFVTKCVGLDAADLEEAVEQQGMATVVYGTPVVPSKVTPELVAGLNAGGAAGGEGQAGAGGSGTGADAAGKGAPGPSKLATSTSGSKAGTKPTRAGAAGSAGAAWPAGASASPAGAAEGADAASGPGGAATSEAAVADPAAPAGSQELTAAAKVDTLASALLSSMLG